MSRLHRSPVRCRPSATMPSVATMLALCLSSPAPNTHTPNTHTPPGLSPARPCRPREAPRGDLVHRAGIERDQVPRHPDDPLVSAASSGRLSPCPANDSPRIPRYAGGIFAALRPEIIASPADDHVQRLIAGPTAPASEARQRDAGDPPYGSPGSAAAHRDERRVVWHGGPVRCLDTTGEQWVEGACARPYAR